MITLFLMSKKGLTVLEEIIINGLSSSIEQVIASKDLSISNDYYNEMKELCKKHKIHFYDKKEKYKINSNFAIAVSWRWIISLNKTKLIVLHDSLLPKYRGFNPLASCLLNQEKEIGVTALYATKNFDAGPIIDQSSTLIDYPIKLKDAIDIICKNYAEVCLKIVKKIKNEKEILSVPQDETRATYSVWRDEQDYRIDWKKSSNEILLKINTLGEPYLGASAFINNKKIRILEAEVYNDLKVENRHVGKVLLKEDEFPVIICGKGLIKIKSAICDKSKKSILPMKKFRVRFT